MDGRKADDEARGPEPPEEAAAAAADMRAFAASKRWTYEDFVFAPEATQVLRRRWLPMGWNVVTWDDGHGRTLRLMHLPSEEGERHWVTVLVRPAAASAGFAARIVCHDREVTEDLASDADADLQTVELADVGVELESEAFDRRYRLLADADQDPVALRQLLSPDLIDHLARLPLDGFSFELQDGALSGFLPGIRTGSAELDALIAATERVHARAEEIGRGSPQRRTAPVGRESRIEDALARHPFTRPPASVREAAKAFRRWPLPFFIDDAAWGLGAEAFFRSYVASIGMELSSPAAVKSTHYEAGVIGDPVHVAHGPLPGATREGWLLLCAGEDPALAGWIEMIVDVPYASNTYAWAGSEDEREAKEREVDLSGTASAICAWKVDEGQGGRTLAGVSAFVGFVAPLLDKYAALAGPGIADPAGES